MGKISDLCFDSNLARDLADGANIEPMPETEFYDLVNNYYLQLKKAFNI